MASSTSPGDRQFRHRSNVLESSRNLLAFLRDQSIPDDLFIVVGFYQHFNIGYIFLLSVTAETTEESLM